MSLGVTQMRLSAPPPLFTRSSDFPCVSHVCLSAENTISSFPCPSHILFYVFVSGERFKFSHRLISVWCCRCQPEEQQPFPLSQVRLLLHGHKQGEDAQESRAYSLAASFQCNTCNGHSANKKKLRRKYGDEEDILKKDLTRMLCRWSPTDGSTKSWTASWLQVHFLNFLIVFLWIFSNGFDSVYNFTN